MKPNSFYGNIFRIFAIYLLLFAVMLAACGQGSQKPLPQQQSVQQQQQQEKEPQKLKDIEKSIEEIIKELDGPAVETGSEKKKSDQQQGGKEGTQDKNTQQGKQQPGQQGQHGQQTQQSQPSQQQPSPQPKDPWKTVSATVDKLHYQWNEYTPDAIKKGAGLKITENFSTSLNYLTTTIASKDKAKTLLAANSLYSSIPDLFSLYRTKMSPEIKRMHFLIRNIVLTSDSGDWALADRDMNNLKSSWTIAKASLGKEQEKDRGKLDLAISELEKVEKEKNKQLTDIKGRVALSNIQSIEKSFEKSSGSTGSG